jgi:GWxTD domain-containing protein
MIRMNSKFSFIAILGIMYVLSSCTSTSEVADREVSSPYIGSELDIKPEFKLFHHSKDSSTLWVKFETANLLYVKEEDAYKANVTIEIDPIPAIENPEIKLSKKKVAVPSIDIDDKGETALAKTDIYLPYPNTYSLEITLRDESNGKRVNKLITTEKTAPNSRENFFATALSTPYPLFSDRALRGEPYHIYHELEQVDKLLVTYYNRTFPLPPPPFAYYEPKPFDYSPDDSFELSIDDGAFSFIPKKEGFYHFRVDESDKEGFTLFVSSDEDFPDIKTIQTMVDPFRYLVSGKEYKKLLEAPALKPSLESFWIDWSGDKTRARKSIKTYYQRVETANKFFSSHVEGWKSDRGLIYIIYGEPNKIYKNSKLETWIYGEEQNPLSLTFRFVKVINPFTTNDYRLNREDYYKPSWYRSIEAWRTGRIY